MSDIGVLICVRVADDMVSVIEGSTKGACDACGEAIWLSPSSRAIQAKQPITTRCRHCQALFNADIGPKHFRFETPNDEQIAEVIRHLKDRL